MGLDSVELVLAVEETFGISISDEDAAHMITPALLISHVQRAVLSAPVQRPCLSQRAFHRIRNGICNVTNFPRSEVRLDTLINHLFPKAERHQRWNDFRSFAGIQRLPNLTFGRGSLFSPKRVRDLIPLAITSMAEEFRSTRDWTHQEVRSVVRLIITEQLGIKNFNDDDEFVRDLGLN